MRFKRGHNNTRSKSVRTQRRDEAVRQINAAFIDLVDIQTHDAVRQRLLQILCEATGYAYALLAEMEPDGLHMHVTSVFAPEQVLAAFEAGTGLSLLGYRFANDPAIALTTPPTEIFTHLSDFRPEISRSIGTTLGQALGLRHVVAIRQQIADQYLGAVSFMATSDQTDLEMLEYLCNNHVVYPLRLMGEQVHRADLEMQRNAEIASLARFPEENPSPVMRILADGSIQYTNRPGAQMLAAAGWKSEGLCPAEWRPRITEALHTGQPVEIEYSAGQRIFACKFAPVTTGGPGKVKQKPRLRQSLRVGDHRTQGGAGTTGC